MAITLTFIGQIGAPPVISGTQRPDQTNAQLIYDYEAVLSGNYTAGGDTLDFTSAIPANGPVPNVAPTDVHIDELGILGTALAGFIYKYVYSNISTAMATPQGGGLQIFGTGTASQDGMNEIAAGAYANTTPSLNNVKLKIRATFAKNP